MQWNEWICLVMLLGASYTDIRQHKIKNIWLFLFFLLGIVCFHLDFLIPSLITLMILFPLFFIRVLGSGDIKLCSVLIGYLGFSTSLEIVFIGLVLAGVYSLHRMISKNIMQERIRYFIHYLSHSLAAGRIQKYQLSMSLKSEAVIPLAPFLCLAFISWRGFQLWTMQV